ncbi:hypothetical protein WMF04_09425 [Sorangium sp. So ce260]|uniref:hypothetical protein n=1 Tax=Sorangium sp. So ce260 TaxID=3133291 RepID=UPI003F62F6CE
MRAKKRCGTVVLVVAPDAGVAAWAAENIDLGLGLGHVEPLVFGPAVVPEITDPVDAEAETELAVLSAVAHGNGPNGLTVVQAARTRARASKHARTLRPSTAGSITSLRRRLPPKCSPDD